MTVEGDSMSLGWHCLSSVNCCELVESLDSSVMYYCSCPFLCRGKDRDQEYSYAGELLFEGGKAVHSRIHSSLDWFSAFMPAILVSTLRCNVQWSRGQ